MSICGSWSSAFIHTNITGKWQLNTFITLWVIDRQVDEKPHVWCVFDQLLSKSFLEFNGLTELHRCDPEVTDWIYINHAQRLSHNFADILQASMGFEVLLRAHIYRTLLMCVPLILKASPLSLSRFTHEETEIRDLRGECSERPGLEPWQSDSTPRCHPLCSPGRQLMNTVHQKHTVNPQMKEEVWEHVKDLLWTEMLISCALCVSKEPPWTPRSSGTGLIYEDLLNSTSWVTTWSF